MIKRYANLRLLYFTITEKYIEVVECFTYSSSQRDSYEFFLICDEKCEGGVEKCCPR